MRILNRALLVSAFGGLTALVAACPASLDDRCANGTCDPSASSSGEGGTDTGGDGPPIDPCAQKPTDPACIDETKAVFVSTRGDDTTGTGVRSQPFKTITHALSRLDASKRRIFVCAGDYPEDVTLANIQVPVSIFGGLDCDWKETPAKPVIGKSPNALRIEGSSSVAITGLAFQAKDAQSGSSVGAFVTGSNVAFKVVRLAAGSGGNGGTVTVTDFSFPAVADLKGNNGDADQGGDPKSYSACPGGGTSVGGGGGDNGQVGSPGMPPLGGGAGGMLAACNSGGGGGNGNKGAAGTIGNGAPSEGTLSAVGWTPANGEAGGPGGVGQGGGGGLGFGGGGGGSGGAGGCGGAGGGAGIGGGASIAIAAVSSVVTIEDSELETKKAGNGGDGAAGQTGQPQGGSAGVQNPDGCSGGTGGPGGDGGPGGGGAGGISVGVLHSGGEPTLDAATRGKIRVGAAGAAGSSPAMKKGAAGIAQPVLAR